MKKTHLIMSLAVFAISAMSCSSTNKADKATSSEATEAVQKPVVTVPAATTTGDVIDLKDDNLFRPGVKAERFTVLDFNATWCVPCKKLIPAYHAAAKDFEGKVDFYSVDIDRNPATAQAFKITNVPTVVFISPSGQVQSFVGLGDFMVGATESTTNAQLTDIITKNLNSLIEKAL